MTTVQGMCRLPLDTVHMGIFTHASGTGLLTEIGNKPDWTNVLLVAVRTHAVFCRIFS